MWERPESLDSARPVYTVDGTVGASDLAGSVTGALAAAAIAWQPTNPTQYDTYMGVAQQVYQFGKTFPGLCAPLKCEPAKLASAAERSPMVSAPACMHVS